MEWGELVENNGQQLIHCSKCGSNKLRKGDSSGTLAATLFLFGILIIWIPILGWIVGTLFILGGVVVLLVSYKSLTTTATMQCMSCRNRFQVDKAVFQQWSTI